MMCHRRNKPGPNVKKKEVHQMNHWFFNKLAMVALVTGLVIALAGGAVFAGSSEQRAEGTFDTAGSGASGEFKLRRDLDQFNFEAKGEGIHTSKDITFCVGGVIIDVDDPDDRGRWELDEDDLADLNPRVVPVIEPGTVVTIVNGMICGDDVILVAELTAADLN